MGIKRQENQNRTIDNKIKPTTISKKGPSRIDSSCKASSTGKPV